MLSPQTPLNMPSEQTEQDGTQELRRAIRARAMQERDGLAPDLRHHISGEIIERLQKYLSEKAMRSVHCYISFRSEVETRAFLEHALHNGMRVTVPIVDRKDGKNVLIHTEISALSELVEGSFGLKEPIERNPASLSTMDAVIVPLVAFDRRGTRLGYGMGFYDTFLQELPRSIERIGLAFHLQEANSIPSLAHDEPLDTIVTEQEIIHVTA